MKTLLSIMVVISIAFSFFTLNSDFSKETVEDNVHNTDTKVVEQADKLNYSSRVDNGEASNITSETQKTIIQHSADSTNKPELMLNIEQSESPEKVLVWISDEEKLANLDAEMGFVEPTEYDQVVFGNELDAMNQHTQQGDDSSRSIALSNREPLSVDYLELDDVMIEEDLPASSTIDQL